MTMVLLQGFRDLAQAEPALRWALPHMQGPRLDVAPQALAATRVLDGLSPHAAPPTKALVDGIVAVAPGLAWQQSYTAEDDGIDDTYLAGYGWFNLISDTGIYASDHLRLSVGFWDAGLRYPSHAHAPEEFYVILAGSCQMQCAQTDRACRPGDIIHVPSNTWHGFQTTDQPLLLAAFWRGAGLSDKPILSTQGTP